MQRTMIKPIKPAAGKAKPKAKATAKVAQGKGAVGGGACGPGGMWGADYGMPAMWGKGFGKGPAMWGPMAMWGADYGADYMAMFDPYGTGGGCAGFGKAGGKAGGCAAPSVPVHWLALAAESENLPGMPLEAPVLTYEKGKDVFSNSSNMLYDLVGDIESKVEIVHDAECAQFPEVAEAIKEAGVEENCIAIAACAEQGKWAVGLAGGWKPRESAAKAALCIALAADHPQAGGFLRNFPEMRPLLQGTAAASAPALPALPSGGGGGGKKQKAAVEPTDALPTVVMVSLDQDSTITQQGFPAEAPAIAYDKSQYIFQSGHHVLGDILGDISENVSFLHDADWDQLPEVGEALKAQGITDQCYVVASCESQGKWAIGMASGWKHRETAAKLALAVAIAQSEPPSPGIANTYPEFMSLLQSTGMDVEVPKAALQPPAKKAKKAKAKAKAGHDLGGETEFDPEAAAEDTPLADGGLQVLPKEQPFWLRMEAPPAILVDGMPSETLLVVEGTARRQLYSTVDKFLSGFVADVATDIECVDDPDWTQFPEIAAALEGYAVQDDCLQVAICAQCAMWAAGVGRKWKGRNQAAKVALATLLAVRTAEGGEAVDCSEFPAFATFIEQAQAEA